MFRKPKRLNTGRRSFQKPLRPSLIQGERTHVGDFSNDMEFSEEDFTAGDLSANLSQNLDMVKNELSGSSDLSIRLFSIGLNKEKQSAVVFIDGLVDKKQVEGSVLTPLMVETSKINDNNPVPNLFEFVESKVITVGDIKNEINLDKIINSILAGNTALLIDGYAKALVINTPGWEKRSVTEPETEVVIRGPKTGFTETLRTNTALLRRYIGNAKLTFENITVGQKSRTIVCIAYVKGVTPDSLITEIRVRLERIKTDAILGAGYIEQFIEDAPLSTFPTVGYTERPDVAAAKILEGRAAVLIDGTPVALTVPSLFVESFQTPDDYNSRPFYQTIIRWIRYIAFIFSVFSPALYVALASFHQELIPTPFLITMAAATEVTPFPSVIEALGMGLVFEILREAGIRLPRPIGQTVSFVGALVIGQATVSAGVVGAPVVILVALTAIASFVNPKLANVSALVRFALTILAGFLGAFGILIGFLVVLIHLTSLRSFGVAYLAPITPTNSSDLKDVLIRTPIWAMHNRPQVLNPEDSERQSSNLMPHPPSETKPLTKRKKDDVL